MRFRSRFAGDLVLENGPIRNRRKITKGETLVVSTKTAERFAESLKQYGQKAMIAPLDDDARQLFGLPRLEQPTEPQTEQLELPVPDPTPTEE